MILFPKIILIICAVVFVATFLWLLRPIKTISQSQPANPSTNYQESLKRIQELEKNQEMAVADYCRPILLTHGYQTEKVAVLYHGYTNCPRQYEKLARLFFDQGYNVYVPRLVYHGSADRVTRDISKLTLDDIRKFSTDSIDVAAGLGEKVTVLGLSMGGVMAAWNAQFFNNIDTAVVIVPSFGWYFSPGIIRPLVNLSRLLPNLFFWWNPIEREKRASPYSMYHHFSSKGSGHILSLGLDVINAARKGPAKARRIIVLENELDKAVDAVTIRRLINLWRRHGSQVIHYVFPKGLNMEHDIIDPLHPNEQTDIVYQKIFELLLSSDSLADAKNVLKR